MALDRETTIFSTTTRTLTVRMLHLIVLNPSQHIYATPLVDITPQNREQSNQPHPKYPDLQLINPEIVAANTATKQKKTLRTLYNDNHPTRPAPATTRRATMARRLPSPPPRSRRNAQAARANDPLDENRLDADHRRAPDGLRGRRHPRQLEHSRARVLVE